LKSSNVENWDVTHKKVAKLYSHKLKLKLKKGTNEIKSVLFWHTYPQNTLLEGLLQNTYELLSL